MATAALSPERRRRRRRSLAALALAAVLLVILLDQLGCRRLSGTDMPQRDPLAPTLRTYVEKLAAPAWGGRVPGTPENDAAARYLADELKRLGVPPLPSVGGYLVPLRSRPSLGANVIGYLPATPEAKEQGTVILGAHFDHLGPVKGGVALGADDNASSVAVLLGALPAIVADTARRHPVMVVFFNTEEAPYFGSPLHGAEDFLRALPPEIPNKEAIRLALILDLIGGVVWQSTADTIFACGAEKAAHLPAIVDQVSEPGLDVRRLGIHAVERLPGYPLMPVSDYHAFRNRRVPFLFLSSGRTPRYHTPDDLPATLYYDRMARTSRWIAKLVAELDAAHEPITFDEGGADLARDRDTLLWAIDTAAKPWSTVPGTGPLTLLRLIGDRSRLRDMSGPGYRFTAHDVESLERASFRLQCLLYSYPACFTL